MTYQPNENTRVECPEHWLYQTKELIFKLLPVLKALIASGRDTRDKWIAGVARSVASGSVVLDVGAGSAPYRERFAHCRYITQDLGRLEDSQLQGRAGYAPLDIISDIERLPLSDGYCDVVVCTEVLEHVPEPIKAIAEMSRVLKPGGLMLLSAPLRSTLHQVPYHYYGGFTPFWYERFLGGLGFSSVEIEPVGGFFRGYAHANLCCALHLSPFEGPLWKRIMCFPLWFITVFWLAFICQIACYALDRMYFIPSETSGYHVRACKAL